MYHSSLNKNFFSSSSFSSYKNLTRGREKTFPAYNSITQLLSSLNSHCGDNFSTQKILFSGIERKILTIAWREEKKYIYGTSKGMNGKVKFFAKSFLGSHKSEKYYRVMVEWFNEDRRVFVIAFMVFRLLVINVNYYRDFLIFQV